MNCFQFFNLEDQSQDPLKMLVTRFVVNCFQFFNLEDQSQVPLCGDAVKGGCELLSVL